MLLLYQEEGYVRDPEYPIYIKKCPDYPVTISKHPPGELLVHAEEPIDIACEAKGYCGFNCQWSKVMLYFWYDLR